MKALYKEHQGSVPPKLIDTTIPKITPRDHVRIRVLACTVCGMDIHISHGKFPCEPPFIMGHEFVGIVDEVGKEATKLQIGDRVVAQPHLYACSACMECQNGFPQYCKDKRSLGISRDGAMAEYVVLPEEYLHTIPNNIPDELACLIEPMTILISDAVVYPKLQKGETVVVTGAGQIALLGVAALKYYGAGKIIVIGTDTDELLRLPAALKLGADAVINCMKEDTVQRIMELTDGMGADLVIEASGSEIAIGTAFAYMRTGARMSILGGTKKDSININWDVCLKKMLKFEFHMMSDYKCIDKSIELFATSPIDLKPLISHDEPLENWEYVFDELTKARGIKAVLRIAKA